MATELRQELSKHLGHRISVRGALKELRMDHQGTRACITDPEMDGEVICSHVWVLGINEEWQAKEGAQVVFDAVVRDYNNGGGRNYCLRNPSNLRVVSPPAIRIPVPAPQAAPTLEPQPMPQDSPSPKPVQDQPASGLQYLRQAKAFAKTCGGCGKALEIIDALPTMPLSVLREYLIALGEE